MDYVRSLGADQAIDYNKDDFTKIGQVCDAVFETVGGDVAAEILCRAQARRPRGLHRLRRQGAARVARRRAGPAPAGAAHPRRDGAGRGIVRRRRGPRARDQALQAVAGRRGAPRQPGPAPPRQARVSGAVKRGAARRREFHRIVNRWSLRSR